MFMTKSEEKKYFNFIREIQMRHINMFYVTVVDVENYEREYYKIIVDRTYYKRNVLCLFKLSNNGDINFIIDSPAFKHHIDDFPYLWTEGGKRRKTFIFDKESFKDRVF